MDDAHNDVRKQVYARVWATNLVMGALFFTYSYGFEAIGYAGFVRRQERLIWVSVLLFPVALYCWYRGDRVDD